MARRRALLATQASSTRPRLTPHRRPRLPRCRRPTTPPTPGGAIDLSWSAATDAVGVTGYKLYRGTAAGVYGTPTALGNVTTYTDATAVTGTRYYYAVSALDAAGNEGAKSPESSAIAADNIAPAVPSGLAAVGGTEQVALTWTRQHRARPGRLRPVPQRREGQRHPDHRHHLHRHGPRRRHDVLLPPLRRRHQRQRELPSARRSPPPPSARRPSPPPSTAPSSRGVDGASLTPAWTLSGTPQKAEYDTTRAKNGTLSGWIEGPSTAARRRRLGPRRHDLQRSGVPLLDVRRHRQPRTATSRTPARSSSCAPTPPASSSSTPSARRPATPPTPTRRSAPTRSGWTEYRIVLDFTSDTYTLSNAHRRRRPWTQLKSAAAPTYAIPMREATDRTTTATCCSAATPTPTCGSTTCASPIPASSTCSAPTPSPPPPAPAARSRRRTPARSPTAASPTFTITPTPATRSPDVLVDGVSVGPSAPTRSPTSPRTTRSPRRFARLRGGDMPVTDVDCDSCHAEHALWTTTTTRARAATTCSDGHPGTPSDMHTPAVVTTCTPCHNAVADRRAQHRPHA